MRSYTTFQRRRDYTVPLLELLAGLPGGRAEKQAVLAEFETRYGALIPPGHRRAAPGRRTSLWAYWLGWQRHELAQSGMLDKSRWGVWGVTASGLRWLAENPMETHLDPLRSSSPRRRHGLQSAPGKGKTVFFRIRGHSLSLTAEHVLAVAREALGGGLPPEAADYRSWAVVVDGQRVGVKWLFRQATGLESFNTSHARDILGRRLGLECVEEKHARPRRRTARGSHASHGEEAVWLEVARKEVRSVRDLLAGRGAQPSDERLCDMVQFCYTFGLYREARQVFALADCDSANSWLYERTRRLATVCEARANR